MTFVFDADVALKASPTSERVKKEYTGKLNALAKAGWGTRRALKRSHKKVIAHIKQLYPGDDEQARFKQRFVLYAIFWAMDAAYISKPNPYHTYVRSIPPLKHSATGADWKPLDQYRAEQTAKIDA